MVWEGLRRRGVALGAALLAGAVAACGSSAGDHPATGAPGPGYTAPTGTRAPAGSPAGRCGDPRDPARTIAFRARDGVRLEGILAGRGSTGVVLLHEYPGPSVGPMCGWWPYAAYLARRGVMALPIDLRCFGDSACPHGRGHVVDDVSGAVAELRRRGARRVVVAGASLGGVVALVAGAGLGDRIDAVADLSGERALGDLLGNTSLNSIRAARHLRVPLLELMARGDRYITVPDARAIAAAAAGPARLVVLPAVRGHGWGMLEGRTTTWAPPARLLLEFLRHG